METSFRQIITIAAVIGLPFYASGKALKPQILEAFNGASGSEPQGALIADTSGNLYGTAQAGGAGGKGTVFRLTPPAAGKTAWTTKAIFTFDGTNGSQPVAGLVADASGNLYGTALTGGASGDGVVFELVAPPAGKSNWTQKLLYSFSGTYGQNPQAGVIFDKSGNLYGATVGGGASSAGTVFKLTPPAAGQSTWTLSTLFSFNGSSAGAEPTGTLILDSAGNIYGTTVNGGAASDGIAFRLSLPGGGGTPWNETLLATFSGANGIHPYAGLVADAAGNLYGTTTKGGTAGDGAVFEVTGGTEKVLVSFSGKNGNYPFANLTIDSKGNLFGVTGGGGNAGQGTLFEVTGGTEKVLLSFNGKNGSGPSAAVLLDSSTGVIYGAAVQGGKHNDGTVFKLTP